MSNHIIGPCENFYQQGVIDKTTYLSYHKVCVLNQKKSVTGSTDPVTASINHSRWIVNCACRGAAFTSPHVPIACCFDCGTVYLNVQFPDNVEMIESILLKRQYAINRNWLPSETVETLMLENQNQEGSQ
jgi:hypothetical protein